MSISSNNKREERRRKETSFAYKGSLGIFIIALMLIAGSSSAFIGSTMIQMMMTSAYAQEPNNTTTPSTTTTTNTSSGIQLSPQPVMQERTTTTSQIPINQTHTSATFTGNGTLTLPDTMDTISYTTNGTAVISLMTHSTQAKATIMTEQGETATATYYEILEIDPAAAGDGKGLTMAVINTDSTGTLAPLNGTIVAGISHLQSNEANTVTLWKWESGFGNNASDSVGAAPPTQ